MPCDIAIQAEGNDRKEPRCCENQGTAHKIVLPRRLQGKTGSGRSFRLHIPGLHVTLPLRNPPPGGDSMDGSNDETDYARIYQLTPPAPRT